MEHTSDYFFKQGKFAGIAAIAIFSILFLPNFVFSGIPKKIVVFQQGAFTDGTGVLTGAVENAHLKFFTDTTLTIQIRDLNGDFAVLSIDDTFTHEILGTEHVFKGTGELEVTASHVELSVDGRNASNSILLLGRGKIAAGGLGRVVTDRDLDVAPLMILPPEIDSVRTETIHFDLSSDLPTQAVVYFKKLAQGEHVLIDPEGGEVPADDYTQVVIPGFNYNHEITLGGLEALTKYELFVQLKFPVNGNIVKSEILREKTDNVNLHPTITSEARGYYYVDTVRNENNGTEHWIFTPHGNAFFLTGVNSLSPNITYPGSIEAKYGSEYDWAQALSRDLKGLNMQAAGRVMKGNHFFERAADMGIVWEPPFLVYGNSHSLPEPPPQDHLDEIFRNPWDPVYVEQINAQAAIYGLPLVQSKAIVFAAGINEVDVYANNYSEEEPCTRYKYRWSEHLINKPAEDIGKQKYVEIMQEYHGGDIANFNAIRFCTDNCGDYVFDPITSWDELGERTFLDLYGPFALEYASDEMKSELMDFTAKLFKEFFTVTVEALRNHAGYQGLIVPATFPKIVPLEILEVYRDFPDDNIAIGMSLYWKNPYSDGDKFGRLQEHFNIAQKPILITEFTFTSLEGGRQAQGYPEVETDAERGPAYETFVHEAAKFPFVIGASWYNGYDHVVVEEREPGNDESYMKWGLYRHVSLEPYTDLMDSIREANASVYEATDERAAFGLEPSGEPLKKSFFFFF